MVPDSKFFLLTSITYKKYFEFKFFSAFFFTHKRRYRKSTHKIENQFGFQKIESGKKQKKVDNVFSKIAERYDLMNDVMSFGIHRIWKDIFINKLSPTPGTKLLDVAGGTGDVGFRFLKYLRNEGATGHVTVCDINQKMLEVGRSRSLELGLCHDQIDWVSCNAENLPFKDDTYDAYTVAFGIRNVTRISKVLEQAYRVLKCGGRFMCLEFSHIHPSLQWIYDQYSFQVIPVIGEVIAGDWKSYQYLVESIRNFPDQENFKKLIEEAGFRLVTYENLTFGIVAIHSAFKF